MVPRGLESRVAAIVAIVAAAEISCGATLAGGSPLYLKDYLEYLSERSAQGGAVQILRGDFESPQITSWNSLLVSLTKSFAGERFLIELDIVKTLAGYRVWGGLVLGARCDSR